MAEPLFDVSGAIPRGRYVAPLNLGRARLADGQPASTFNNAIPTARFGRSGLEVESGADALRAARGMGRQTAPVAMSMAGLRAAHKEGLLGAGTPVANFSRKQEIRMSGGPATLGIVIDLSDLANLGNRMDRIGIGIRRQHSVIAMAINDGVRKLRTDLKRKLQGWTGIRQQARITKAMRETWATAATMTGKLTVADRHLRITTESFGAAWSRANPGGTHKAWNRPQMAVGSFMIRGSRSKIRGDLLFKRVSKARYPIAPLWGPSLPREVDRHRAEVQRDLHTIVRARVLATASRLMAMEIAKAGG